MADEDRRRCRGGRPCTPVPSNPGSSSPSAGRWPARSVRVEARAGNARERRAHRVHARDGRVALDRRHELGSRRPRSRSGRGRTTARGSRARRASEPCVTRPLRGLGGRRPARICFSVAARPPPHAVGERRPRRTTTIGRRAATSVRLPRRPCQPSARRHRRGAAPAAPPARSTHSTASAASSVSRPMGRHRGRGSRGTRWAAEPGRRGDHRGVVGAERERREHARRGASRGAPSSRPRRRRRRPHGARLLGGGRRRPTRARTIARWYEAARSARRCSSSAAARSRTAYSSAVLTPGREVETGRRARPGRRTPRGRRPARDGRAPCRRGSRARAAAPPCRMPRLRRRRASSRAVEPPPGRARREAACDRRSRAGTVKGGSSGSGARYSVAT